MQITKLKKFAGLKKTKMVIYIIASKFFRYVPVATADKVFLNSLTQATQNSELHLQSKLKELKVCNLQLTEHLD